MRKIKALKMYQNIIQLSYRDLRLLATLQEGDRINVQTATISRGWAASVYRFWSSENRQSLKPYFELIYLRLESLIPFLSKDELQALRPLVEQALPGLAELSRTYRYDKEIQEVIEEMAERLTSILAKISLRHQRTEAVNIPQPERHFTVAKSCP